LVVPFDAFSSFASFLCCFKTLKFKSSMMLIYL